MTNSRKLELIRVSELLPIENFGPKKATNLRDKIFNEGKWIRPICVHKFMNNVIVMDGHHRLAAAKKLQCKYIPCIFYSYDEVEVSSMRKNYEITVKDILDRALSGNIYPYKTVKHEFPGGYQSCNIRMVDLY